MSSLIALRHLITLLCSSLAEEDTMLATECHTSKREELRRFSFFQELRKEKIISIISHTCEARVLASECPEAPFIINTSATVLYHPLSNEVRKAQVSPVQQQYSQYNDSRVHREFLVWDRVCQRTRPILLPVDQGHRRSAPRRSTHSHPPTAPTCVVSQS